MNSLEHTRILQYHFLLCTFEDVLFYSVLAHETENVDMGLLTDPVRSCHSLQVILRIPVALRVLEVSANKANTKQTRTSKMMTVSAVSRLIPRPPARVESKKAKSESREH